MQRTKKIEVNHNRENLNGKFYNLTSRTMTKRNLVQYSLNKQSYTAFYVDFSVYWSSDAHELI